MCPNQNGSPTFEDRLAALEVKVAELQSDLEKNNENITDSLKVLIEALIAMRNEHCDLPPGCDTVLTLNEEPKT